MQRQVILLFVVALAGCPQQPKPQEDPNVVATVNEELITTDDFEQLLSREAQPMEGMGPRTPEQIEPYKQTLLDGLIDRLLVLQAARAAGISVTPEEVDRRVLALSSEYPAGTFDRALEQSQTSRTALNRSTREQLTMEKFLNEQVFSRVAVTEEQLRAAYEARAQALEEPERVRAQQIVVKGLDEAKRLGQQLAQGKKFSDLARRYSLSPDAKVGGDLGFFARGEMPRAFDEVVFRLNVGQTSDVVSTEYGFHLFKVLEKRPARRRPFAEVRDALERTLVSEMRAQAQKSYVASLRAKATVQVNRGVLQQISGRVAAGQSPEP